MPNEFIARNGLIALNNTTITGSLNVTAGITGSLFGTASWAQNAVTSSYILSAVSASFATSASLAQTASYVLNAVSASFASTASSVNTLNQNVIISGSLTVFTGSAIEFQVTNTGTKIGNATTDTHTVTGSLNISGSENIRGSGSAVFTVDGTSGRLFSVDDSLSGSLFSVNTAAGLPVVEAFSDNTVRIGQYGQRALFVSQSRVGIGKETALNANLDVSGSVVVTGSVNLTAGSYNLLATGGQNLFFNNSGQLGSSATGTHITMNPAGNTTTFSQVVTSQNGFNATPGGNATTYALRTTVGAYPSAILASFTSGSVTVLSISGSGMISTGSFNHLGNLSIAGTITAQTLVVQTITSSVSFITGSTQFGSLLANTHQFTGSVSMTGSLNVIGGNVGIGTTTPSSSLEINKNVSYTEIIGSAINPAIRIKNTNSANFNEKAEVQFTIGNSVLPTAAISNLYTSYTAGSQQGGDLVFSTRVAGSTLDERMRITAAGNVGINTTSPSNLFEVNGISAVVNSYGAFTALQASGSTGYRWTLANDASFRLQYTTNGFSGLAGTPLYVSSSGNIGIGTTSPSLKLDVSGSDAIFNGVRVGRGAGNIASNTIIGSGSLASNTTGVQNTALGFQSLTSNTTGYNNVAIGHISLQNNKTGLNNVAIGLNSLQSNTSGINNTALGTSALIYNTTGNGNTAIGSANYLTPAGTNLTTQNGILSLSSADQPEIWGQLVQFEVPPTDSATILSIDATVYAGAVVDYSLQDDAGAQRTSTMLIAFDCSANVNYIDPNPTEVGAGLGDYTFIPINNGTVDLNLTNNSGTQYCVIVLSCRLLKRYYGC